MKIIQDTLAGVKIGGEFTHQNLTLFPLIGGVVGEPGYQTLDEALAAGTARVTEVSAGGSVPELRFVNDGDRSVFLMDGEELVGAKQNRTLNISLLIAARSSLTIPVTCVEAGRWSAESAQFAAASHGHYAAGRALKARHVSDNLRDSGSRHADQGAVWADIEGKAQRLAAHSPTHAMSAIFEQHAGSVEDFVRALPAGDGQAGALFAINGRLVGLDLFNSPATLAKLLPKIVRSYALDALDAREAKPVERTATAAADFLRSVAQAEAKTYPALGLGEDARLAGETVAGGALIAEKRLIHLSAFHTAPAAGERPESHSAPLARASARQQHYRAR